MFPRQDPIPQVLSPVASVINPPSVISPSKAKMPNEPIKRGPAQASKSRRLDLRHSFQPDPDIRVGKGHVFTKDVGAIPKAEYSTKLGKLLYEDSHLSYFKKSTEEVFIPVAYNASRGKFYPISQILHVLNVSTELRDQLISEGHHEYHYLQHLKLLFIQSTPEELLKTYEQLQLRGLKVELEVLKEAPQTH